MCVLANGGLKHHECALPKLGDNSETRRDETVGVPQSLQKILWTSSNITSASFFCVSYLFFFHIRTIGPYKSMSSGRTGDDSLRRVLGGRTAGTEQNADWPERLGDLIQVKVCHEILSVLFKDLQSFLLPSKDGCPLRQRGKAIREVCDPEGRREVEKKKASGDDLPCSVGEHHVLLKLAL